MADIKIYGKLKRTTGDKKVADLGDIVNISSGDYGKSLVLDNLGNPVWQTQANVDNITYQFAASATTPDENTHWYDEIPEVGEDEYLWQKIIISYKNGTSATFISQNSVHNGPDGDTVVTTTITQYRLSTSSSNAEADISKSWSNTILTPDPTDPYLWARPLTTVTINGVAGTPTPGTAILYQSLDGLVSILTADGIDLISRTGSAGDYSYNLKADQISGAVSNNVTIGGFNVGQNAITAGSGQTAMSIGTAGIEIGNVDNEIQFKVDNKGEVWAKNIHLTGYATSTDLQTVENEIPTNVSDLDDASDYAQKTDLPTDLGDLTNDAGYSLETSTTSAAYTLAQGKSKTTYSATAPTDKAVGDCWFDTTNKLLKQWSGTDWVDVGGELVAKKVTAAYVNALGIDAQSITVGDPSTPVLYANANDANNVKVGGFKVGTSSLESGTVNTNNYVHIGTDGIVLGNNAFVVNPAGNVTATSFKEFDHNEISYCVDNQGSTHPESGWDTWANVINNYIDGTYLWAKIDSYYKYIGSPSSSATFESTTYTVSSKGTPGTPGSDGSDGADGNDGFSPYIDPNTGNWVTSTGDTGIHAEGKDGTSVNIKGSVANHAALLAIQNKQEGDSYLVEDASDDTDIPSGKPTSGILYVYAATNDEWLYVGQIKGEDGKSTYALILSRNLDSVPCNSAGNPTDPNYFNVSSNTSHTISAIHGSTAITFTVITDINTLPLTGAYVVCTASNVTIPPISSATGVLNFTNYLTGMTADKGTITYDLYVDNLKYATATFTEIKNYAGIDGLSPVKYDVEDLPKNGFVLDKNGIVSPDIFTATLTKTVGDVVDKQIIATYKLQGWEVGHDFRTDNPDLDVQRTTSTSDYTFSYSFTAAPYDIFKLEIYSQDSPARLLYQTLINVVADGADGKSITSIAKTDTQGLVDTYTITYSDNTTSLYTVTNGRQGDNGTSISMKANAAACQAIGDSYIDTDGYLQTLIALNPQQWLANKIVNDEYKFDEIPAVLKRTNTGILDPDILSMILVKTTGANENRTIPGHYYIKCYRVGDDPTDPTCNPPVIEQNVPINGSYYFTHSFEQDSNIYDLFDISFYTDNQMTDLVYRHLLNVVSDGDQGPTGKSITSVTKTGTSGLLDTYTITYSDGTSTTYTITNGQDGDNNYIHYVYCSNPLTGADYSAGQNKVSQVYVGVYADQQENDIATWAALQTAIQGGLNVVWSKAEGTDAVQYYVHHIYCDDPNNITQATYSDSIAKKYVYIYTDTNQNAYTWDTVPAGTPWVQLLGENNFIHFVYCSNTSTGADYSTTVPSIYMGTYTDSNSADYATWNELQSSGVTVSWSLVKDEIVSVVPLYANRSESVLPQDPAIYNAWTWTESTPTYVEGNYYWTRQRTTRFVSGATDSTPVLCQELNEAFIKIQGKSKSFYGTYSQLIALAGNLSKGDAWFCSANYPATEPYTYEANNLYIIKTITESGGTYTITTEAVVNETVVNKLTANWVNANEITAKKIEILDNGSTLFKADGTGNNRNVQIGGFTVANDNLYKNDASGYIKIGTDEIILGHEYLPKGEELYPFKVTSQGQAMINSATIGLTCYFEAGAAFNSLAWDDDPWALKSNITFTFPQESKINGSDPTIYTLSSFRPAQTDNDSTTADGLPGKSQGTMRLIANRTSLVYNSKTLGEIRYEIEILADAGKVLADNEVTAKITAIKTNFETGNTYTIVQKGTINAAVALNNAAQVPSHSNQGININNGDLHFYNTRLSNYGITTIDSNNQEQFTPWNAISGSFGHFVYNDLSNWTANFTLADSAVKLGSYTTIVFTPDADKNPFINLNYPKPNLLTFNALSDAITNTALYDIKSQVFGMFPSTVNVWINGDAEKLNISGKVYNNFGIDTLPALPTAPLLIPINYHSDYGRWEKAGYKLNNTTMYSSNISGFAYSHNHNNYCFIFAVARPRGFLDTDYVVTFPTVKIGNTTVTSGFEIVKLSRDEILDYPAFIGPEDIYFADNINQLLTIDLYQMSSSTRFSQGTTYNIEITSRVDYTIGSISSQSSGTTLNVDVTFNGGILD